MDQCLLTICLERRRRRPKLLLTAWSHCRPTKKGKWAKERKRLVNVKSARIADKVALSPLKLTEKTSVGVLLDDETWLDFVSASVTLQIAFGCRPGVKIDYCAFCDKQAETSSFMSTTHTQSMALPILSLGIGVQTRTMYAGLRRRRRNGTSTPRRDRGNRNLRYEVGAF